MLKHIPVQLQIPQDKFDVSSRTACSGVLSYRFILQENVGKNILRVDGGYTDNAMKDHSFTDYIKLLSNIKKGTPTGNGGHGMIRQLVLSEAAYAGF